MGQQGQMDLLVRKALLDLQAHKVQSAQQGRKEILAQRDLLERKAQLALLDHREFKAYRVCRETLVQLDPRA